MALNAYLKIDGINVTNSDGRPVQATIQLESFSWGLTDKAQVGGRGGGGAGRARGSLSVSKFTDDTTKQLFTAANNGKVLKNATVTLLPAVQKVGGEPVLTFKYDQVLVSSLEFDANRGGAELALETFKFEYQGITLTVTEVNNG